MMDSLWSEEKLTPKKLNPNLNPNSLKEKELFLKKKVKNLLNNNLNLLVELSLKEKEEISTENDKKKKY